GLFEYDGTSVHYRTGSHSASFANPTARAAYEAGWPRVPDRGSLSCRAILDSTIVHVRDMDAEPGVSEEVRALGNKSQIAVPLMRNGRAIGAISTGSPRLDGISDTQIQLVKTFAEQAVIAIQTAETWRELQARTRDLEESLEYQTATSDVLKVISRSTFDLQPVLDTLVETAVRLCNADSANITNREGEAYRVVATFAHSAEYHAYMRGRLVPANRGSAIGRTALGGRVVHIEDAATDPEYTWNEAQQIAQWHTVLGVPLLRQAVVVGVIALSRQRVEPCTERQIELVRTFADQAVIAIENTRLLTEIREALEQQQAIAEVLQVINSSPGDITPVFDAMLERAMRLCNASLGDLRTYDGLNFHVAALRGVPPAYAKYMEENPLSFGPETGPGRILQGERVIHV